MKNKNEDIHVEQLTRNNYKRDSKVVEQIKAALQLPPDLLIERARHGHNSPNYLQEECLVYFIREFHGKEQDNLIKDLSEILLKRCSKKINDNLKVPNRENRNDAFGDVILKMFEQILDLESDRGDFLQVRFWVALERIIISTFKNYIKDISWHRDNIVTISSLADQTVNESRNDRSYTSIENLPDTSISNEDLIFIKDALNILNEPLRTAFFLRHYEGWLIESKNPHEPTISSYFKVTSRTVRNWLIYAEDKLKKWRGEKI